MGTLKLMKKPDFQQLLEGLMIVDMMTVRTYWWIHVMMKHSLARVLGKLLMVQNSHQDLPIRYGYAHLGSLCLA